jgi:CubicO group peptidase (beta-lactamase class C family)
VRRIIERAADAELNDALRTLVFNPLGVESVFVARASVDFDAIVWGNAQGYDPRWVYHGCIVGSLSWAATCLHRLMHGSTITVFSALTLRRTFAASVGTDAPGTFPKLIEYLRTLS